MSPLNTTTLPNLSTPLALLDPTTAYQTTVSNFASVGALAILLWDIIENAASDYRLLSTSRISIAVLAYLGSRIGNLGYLLGASIYSTAPTGNCAIFEKAVTAFCPLAVGCSALLFFLRLRAIYNRNPVVIAIFAIFLLGLVASTVFVPLGIVGGAVADTQYCHYASVAKSVNVGHIAPMVYDTLVYVAISWRLRSVASFEMGVEKSFEVMAFGKHLPAFTKALLLDGQFYYFVTLLAGIPVIVLNFAPGVPRPLRSLTNDPYLVIVNIMACRVYRRTRLALIRESQISTTALAETRATRAIVFVNTTSGCDSTLSHNTPTPSESTGESKSEVC